MAPIIPVDPQGNTLLHTSSSSLRVSSKTLSLASPVFASLFTSTPASVNLPSDDPDALAAIVNIFHFNFGSVPKDQISLQLLYEIAVVGGKYECIKALDPWLDRWLSRWGDCRGACEGDDWRKLLVISHIFGRMDIFEWAGKQAVVSAIYEDLKARINVSLFPGSEKAIANIMEHRARLISSILECTSRAMQMILTADHLCYAHSARCEALILGSALKGLVKCGPYPPPSSPYPGMSVEKIVRGLQDLELFVENGEEHKKCGSTVEKWKRGLLNEVNDSLQSLGVVTIGAMAVDASSANQKQEALQESPKQFSEKTLNKAPQEPALQEVVQETPSRVAEADATTSTSCKTLDHIQADLKPAEPTQHLATVEDTTDTQEANDGTVSPTSVMVENASKSREPEAENVVEKTLEANKIALESSNSDDELYELLSPSAHNQGPSTPSSTSQATFDALHGTAPLETPTRGVVSAYPTPVHPIQNGTNGSSTPSSPFQTNGREIVAEDLEMYEEEVDVDESMSERSLEGSRFEIELPEKGFARSEDEQEETSKPLEAECLSPISIPDPSAVSGTPASPSCSDPEDEDIRTKTVTLSRIYPDVPPHVLGNILVKLNGDLVAAEKQLETMKQNFEHEQEKALRDKKLGNQHIPDPRLQGSATLTVREIAQFSQITQKLRLIFPGIAAEDIMLAVKKNGGDEDKTALELSGEKGDVVGSHAESNGAFRVQHDYEKPRNESNTRKSPASASKEFQLGKAENLQEITKTSAQADLSPAEVAPAMIASPKPIEAAPTEICTKAVVDGKPAKTLSHNEADSVSQQEAPPRTVLQPVAHNIESKPTTPTASKFELGQVSWTPSERAALMLALSHPVQKETLKILRKRFRNVASARILDAFYRSGWNIDQATDILHQQGFVSVPGSGNERENSRSAVVM